jgi:hypothetical protein
MAGAASIIVCTSLHLTCYCIFNCCFSFSFCFCVSIYNEGGVCSWPHQLLIWWGDQCPTQTTLSQGDLDLQITINKKKETSKQSLPSLQTNEEGGINISWSLPSLQRNKKKEASKQSLPSLQTRRRTEK